MRKITVMLLGAAILVAAAAAGAYADPIRIGVGIIGPISPQTEADIDTIVGQLPNVKVVPIQPPGGVDKCVQRFVAHRCQRSRSCTNPPDCRLPSAPATATRPQVAHGR